MKAIIMILICCLLIVGCSEKVDITTPEDAGEYMFIKCGYNEDIHKEYNLLKFFEDYQITELDYTDDELKDLFEGHKDEYIIKGIKKEEKNVETLEAKISQCEYGYMYELSPSAELFQHIFTDEELNTLKDQIQISNISKVSDIQSAGVVGYIVALKDINNVELPGIVVTRKGKLYTDDYRYIDNKELTDCLIQIIKDESSGQYLE